MLTALGIGKPDKTATPPESPPIDTESQDEEWEYCEGISE
jgi:hypothetical protein